MNDKKAPWRAIRTDSGWFVGTQGPSFDMVLELQPGLDFKWDLERYARWLAKRLNTFPPYEEPVIPAKLVAPDRLYGDEPVGPQAAYADYVRGWNACVDKTMGNIKEKTDAKERGSTKPE
jgi:hypothetical protein